MKESLLSFLALIFFAPQSWSQTPEKNRLVDYVITMGEFRAPGRVPYVAGMKVSDAILAANYWTEFAPARLYLIRSGKGEQIDYTQLSTDPSKDRTLEPWDILYLNPDRVAISTH